ncbi:TRAP transporter small permease [Azospirillum sp.]|uniref:TRAP transporter small permease n=1 Tax=Azospirillum sp. TaxID=34012 RepID=UPI002D6A8E5F|nr:TRAP transporter small permease subunit [Azospirillum sp.]HYD69090.1 TRAP transporter small permease subunit [Azospirillum sp.]
MTGFLEKAGPWLARRAENVAVAMLAAMFAAFLLQIVFRYVLGLPIGWTHEVSVILWIWIVLWGAAFVTTDAEEIRFDIVYGAVRPRTRRAMCAVTAVVLVALYLVSLPAVIDYVSFMKVQKTTYLKIRYDWLFSIYVVFAVAAILRHLWLGWQALFHPERDAEESFLVKVGSGE